MPIPQEILDQILDRTDIVEVISGYIPLKKAGRNFKANCPFHNEKTPSFSVSPDKQIFHCFGCGAGGNAIGFVMKYENLTFPEAVRMLADKAGVALPEYERSDRAATSLSSRLYEANKLAAAFFQNVLRSARGKPAFEYMKKRGLDTDTMGVFRIGYAPDEWEALRRYCEKKGIPSGILREAGLTIPSEKNKNDYDRFRNRIIFPIFNERGHILAFGGRVMDDSLPKYINSPETPIYSKSNVLYGLHLARRGVREKGYVVIVEGYMDVVIPYQYGVTNLVATSGTALTSQQASMMKKYTDTAVMLFDADQAGESASLRGLDVLIDTGMNVNIATLPEKHDPDSFIRENGPDGFHDVITRAKDIFDYKLDLLFRKKGANNIGAVAGEMLPTISRVKNAVVQSDYLRRLADRLGVHEASLRHELGKVRSDHTYTSSFQAAPKRSSRNYRNSELHLLGLAIGDRSMFERLDGETDMAGLRDEDVKKVLEVIKDLYTGEVTSISPGKLLNRLKGDEGAHNAAVLAVKMADIIEDTEKAFKDCIACVRREKWEEELKELTTQLKKAQELNNDPEMKRLLLKINQMHKERVA